MVSGQVNEWTSEQVAYEDRQSNIGTSLFFITSNLFTCPLVNLLLERTLFPCYFVFNYPVYKQLVYLSTCLLVHYKSVLSPTFRSLSVSVCKKEICSFCSSVSSVRECCDRVAIYFLTDSTDKQSP